MIIRLGIKIHNSSRIGYPALNIFRTTTEIKLLHDKRASFKCDDFEKVSIRLVLFIFFGGLERRYNVAILLGN